MYLYYQIIVNCYHCKLSYTDLSVIVQIGVKPDSVVSCGLKVYQGRGRWIIRRKIHIKFKTAILIRSV